MNKSVGDRKVHKVWLVPTNGMVHVRAHVKERKRAVRVFVCEPKEVSLIKHTIEDEIIGMPLRNASKLLKKTLANHYEMMTLLSGDTNGESS